MGRSEATSVAMYGKLRNTADNLGLALLVNERCFRIGTRAFHELDSVDSYLLGIFDERVTAERRGAKSKTEV